MNFLVAHGTYLDSHYTVFQAEAIALDEPTAVLNDLILVDRIQ